MEMVEINKTNEIKSVFSIDSKITDVKNPKLFYHLFDEKYKKDSYYLA